ncbi:MAG TPA: GDP-L-fucose synthase [Methanoregulaceae archaeon]|nr:GDP-L-fucose synthase [Methanoregulaceae archaeon]HPD75516.1 GDP-L-fucose synthase [Methanoregulaceae archaeon]HRY75719.1 GDP-L-fucose synthase [Methanoregulaceae archaeon]
MTYLSGKKVLVTGGAGFFGSQVVTELVRSGVERHDIRVPRSREIDLRKPENCTRVVKDMDVVIHLAARVGGIGYNQACPAQLFFDNAIMGIQMIEAAYRENVGKCVVVGTICAYPKFTPVPFREEDLWKGYPEETNAPYGLAKKMLLVQAQAYRQEFGFNAIYLLPVNLYGPGDNFDPASSHVIPALIKKFTDAKRAHAPVVDVWGTGAASREFLYVTDAARGLVLAAERYNKPDPVNLGSGMEISIRDLVALIRDLTGYTGEVHWDTTKPDGQPRRCLDITRAKHEFGFVASMPFSEGLQRTIAWYEDNYPAGIPPRGEPDHC